MTGAHPYMAWSVTRAVGAWAIRENSYRMRAQQDLPLSGLQRRRNKNGS